MIKFKFNICGTHSSFISEDPGAWPLTTLQVMLLFIAFFLEHIKYYTRCNRTGYTNPKIYWDQVNSNITTEFLTFIIISALLQVFRTAAPAYWLRCRHPDDVAILIRPTACPVCSKALALTVLSWSSWRSIGMSDMYTLSFKNPKIKSLWMSD
jgi:hypothetical protein